MEQEILPHPSPMAKLLVRFKVWLETEGQAVGDTDIESAEIFLRGLLSSGELYEYLKP